MTVEIGAERVAADAEVLAEPERTEVYAEHAARHHGFADYAAKTTRVIPVVALTLRRDGAAS